MEESGGESINPLIYVAAIILGVIAEFMGFEIEQWMIHGGISAKVGFPVSLLIFTLVPFLTTGFVVYKATRDYFLAVILSTLVIPVTLALVKALPI